MSLGGQQMLYCEKKPQETGAKDQATQEKKSSNFQHQQKPAIHPIQNCWECLHCKAVNFPRPRPAINARSAAGHLSGGLDPGQAH